MLVWIHPIHFIAVECKRRACLDSALENKTDKILEKHGAFLYAVIMDAIKIAFSPLITIEILKMIALDNPYLMRAHHVPHLVKILRA